MRKVASIGFDPGVRYVHWGVMYGLTPVAWGSATPEEIPDVLAKYRPVVGAIEDQFLRVPEPEVCAACAKKRPGGREAGGKFKQLRAMARNCGYVERAWVELGRDPEDLRTAMPGVWRTAYTRKARDGVRGAAWKDLALAAAARMAVRLPKAKHDQAEALMMAAWAAGARQHHPLPAPVDDPCGLPEIDLSIEWQTWCELRGITLGEDGYVRHGRKKIHKGYLLRDDALAAVAAYLQYPTNAIVAQLRDMCDYLACLKN